MRCVPVCLTLATLFAIQTASAAPLAKNSPVGCPPAKTFTAPPSSQPELVLAEGPQLVSERVAGPFDQPRSVGFLPDGAYLVAERPGRLLLVGATGVTRAISGVPDVSTVGHGGIIDLALDPDYPNNALIYFSYLVGSEQSSTIRVMKAKLDENGEALSEQQVLFETSPGLRPDQIGGRIALTPDGHLFLTVGDRWLNEPAQDVTNDLGTVIRIRTDGSIPEDNPFRWREGARPEIWSYGHRNVQAAALHPETGQFWTVEHGARGGDELNHPEPGKNYGWPVITYGVDYDGSPIGEGTAMAGMEQPVYYWDPVIAPSGMTFYTGMNYPGWQGSLFIGSLNPGLLVRLILKDGQVQREERYLGKLGARIRDVQQGPDGFLYLLTDHDDGRLLRVVKKP